MTTGEKANEILTKYCRIIYGLPINECASIEDARECSVYHVQGIIDSNPMCIIEDTSMTHTPIIKRYKAESLEAYWIIVIDLIRKERL